MGAEFFAFLEVVVSGARLRNGAVLRGLRIIFHHGDYAAIFAHLEAVRSLIVSEYCMTIQLRNQLRDCRFLTEGLITADAFEGFFLLQNLIAASALSEANLWCQADAVLLASIALEPALYAALFIELKLKHVRVVLYGPVGQAPKTG